MSVRELAKQERVDRALNAARAILRRDGLDGLQIRSIADEAGLAVRTLYNQFGGGKSDVLLALMSQELNELSAELDALKLDDGIEMSRAIITVSIERFRASEDMMRPLMALTYASSDKGTTMLANQARGLQEFAIAKAIRQRQLDDLVPATVLAHLVLDAYSNAGHRWARGSIDHEGFEAQALHTWSCLLLGLAKGETRTRMEAEIQRLAPRMQELVKAAQT
ncbi:MAG: TetR/AcrR family transcriptional regulator [Pseudomonadota bacterium]